MSNRPDHYEVDIDPNTGRGTVRPGYNISTIIVCIIAIIAIFAIGISIFDKSAKNAPANTQSQTENGGTNGDAGTYSKPQQNGTLDFYVLDGTYGHRGPIVDSNGKSFDCNYWSVPVEQNNDYPNTCIHARMYDTNYKYISGAFFPNPENVSDATFEVFIYGAKSGSLSADFELLYYSGEFSQNSGAIMYNIDISEYIQLDFSAKCKATTEQSNNPQIVFTDADLIE